MPKEKDRGSTINPRWKSGRRKIYQQRFRAMGLNCALCGRPIDYSAPYYIIDERTGKKHVNPWAFCIDEKIPISKWKEAGYSSPAAAADDFGNLQQCHVKCNAAKGNKLGFSFTQKQKANEMIRKKKIDLDGDW